jgi:hypothetical protein
VRRVAHAAPELTYTDELNACIAEARKEGYAVHNPERGLAYIVLTDRAPSLDQAMKRL